MTRIKLRFETSILQKMGWTDDLVDKYTILNAVVQLENEIT